MNDFDFLGESELKGLDEIDYYLGNVENACSYLRSFLLGASNSDFDPQYYYKEVFQLIQIQNQCNRVKGDCINLKIALDRLEIL